MPSSDEQQPLTIFNLTPHEVVIDLGDGEVLRFPGASRVPRLVLGDGESRSLSVRQAHASAVASAVPLVVGETLLGVEPPLPQPRDGVLLLTSRVVAEHHPERDDLVWPDDLIRDEAGRVIAARRLACLAQAGHATPPGRPLSQGDPYA